MAESQNALDQIRYTVTGYTDTVRVAFGDTGAAHSPIIGYAYDGNPIYCLLYTSPSPRDPL